MKSARHYALTLVLMAALGGLLDIANIALGSPLWDMTLPELVFAHLSVLAVYTVAYFVAFRFTSPRERCK